MLISILHDALDLQPKPTFSVTVVPAPITPATYMAVCDDGSQLAFKVMSTGDLFHALKNQTLYPALIEMRNLSPWSYLLITRSKKGVDDGIANALIFVQEMGIATEVINPDDLVARIEKIAARERGERRIRPPRDVLFADADLDMLLSLPGIGEKKAAELLEHTNSAAWALMILTDDRYEFSGIGPETRRKIREAIGLKNHETFHVETTGESDG